MDVFWLGALAPNWRLELKVVGGTTQLALFRLGGVDPIPLPTAADPSYGNAQGPRKAVVEADLQGASQNEAIDGLLAKRSTEPLLYPDD